MRGFPHEDILLPLAAPVLHTTLASAPPDRHGKVRDIYDFGDRLLIVATDRISAFDYVLGSGIPDKGKVLTQISAFWFDRHAPIVDQPPHVDRPGRLSRVDVRPRARRCSPAARCSCGGPSRCRSSASRAATCRARAGRTTGDRAGLRHRAARRPARVGPPAGADLHAGDQGAERPRHQHQRGRGGRRSSDPACSRGRAS